MAKLAIKIIKNSKNSAGEISIYVSLTLKNDVRLILTGFEIDDEAKFEDGLVCYRKDAAIMNKRKSLS